MISAIVLAAGKATRFGECKQLAPIDGKPLLTHVVDSLRRSSIDDVVVVLGANAGAIREEVDLDGTRVVLNYDYAQGMSTSIHAGLRALHGDTEAVLLVLGDQPFVEPSTINVLIDHYAANRATVVIPTYNGFRGNPVLIDKSLFPEMMNLRGDIGCRAIFGEHADSIEKVEVTDPGVVADIDTAEDLVRFSELRATHLERHLERGSPDPPPAAVPAAGYEAVAPKTTVGNAPVTSSTVVSPDTVDGASETTPTTPDLLETAVNLRKLRHPFAIATVVRAERPTSSKPGDKAIIAPDGTLTGWIGGSCAHDIVVRNALESLKEGTPRFLTLSSASPSDVKRQGVIDIPMQCYSGGVLDVFIEPSLPKPQMVVVGYETIARALVRISKTLAFHVTVVDPLASAGSVPEADEVINDLDLTSLPLSGESFIVIATHGRYDEEALEQAAKTSASYIALVASPKRAAVILDHVRSRGLSREALERIKSPAGLNIGAQGAEEIALSIVAEIVKHRRAEKPQETPHIVEEPEPVDAIDPICHMTVRIAGARYTAEHAGQRYYFCCSHCQQTFEKDPHRYAHVA